MPHVPPDVDGNRLELAEKIAEVAKKEMRYSAKLTLRREFVPNRYRILLHPDDYDWLGPVRTDLREEIEEELSELATELNEETDFLTEFVERVTQIPLLGRFVEWLAEPVTQENGRTIIVRGPWQVEFVASEDVSQDNVQIQGWIAEEEEVVDDPPGETELSASTGGDPGGTATDPYKTFSSTLKNTLPGDRDQDGPEEMSSKGGDSAHAILKYPDENGQTESFTMTKDKVKVGRGGDMWVDLELGFVEKDISREHLLVRYNPEPDRIEVKSVGRFGTEVNGETIDEEKWHPISDGATVVMGGRDDLPIHVEIPSE